MGQMSPPQIVLDSLRPRVPRPHRAAPALLLVANVNASGVSCRREALERAHRLLRVYAGRVELRATESVEELASLFPADPTRRVVLLGGDGTLHAAANLPGPKPELALLPAGRANNVARSLGIPADLRAAARVAARGRVRPLDLITAAGAGRRYFAVEGVSVGFHAVARAGYRATNSADLLAAARAGLGALGTFHPIPVAVESDGAARVMTVNQLFVANLPLYGFGLRVAPSADPTDGLLDLVAIEGGGRASLVTMLTRLRRGTHVDRPGASTWRARRIRIATGGRSPVIADSTNLGSGPVDLAVEPAALNVVVP